MTDFESIARHQRLRHLHLDRLPEEEMPYGKVLWFQLSSLESYLKSFQDALDLFDRFVADLESPDVRFIHIAARDGSITLWNYATALKAVKHSLDKSPTLRARMQVSQVEQALRDFWTVFRDAKRVRDSVGHQSELMKSPTEWDKNSLATGHVRDGINIGASSFWIGNLVGRTYSTTAFGGNVVEYEISSTTLQRLTEITNSVFAAIAQDRG